MGNKVCACGGHCVDQENHFTQSQLDSIEKGLKQAKEGRTYTFSCSHVKEIDKLCHECHVEDCKKWYKLGTTDERKNIDNEQLKTIRLLRNEIEQLKVKL